MRRVVDAMDSLLNCAAPGLLVCNNIVVDATFKLTKINRLHLTIRGWGDRSKQMPSLQYHSIITWAKTWAKKDVTTRFLVKNYP